MACLPYTYAQVYGYMYIVKAYAVTRSCAGVQNQSCHLPYVTKSFLNHQVHTLPSRHPLTGVRIST